MVGPLVEELFFRGFLKLVHKIVGLLGQTVLAAGKCELYNNKILPLFLFFSFFIVLIKAP